MNKGGKTACWDPAKKQKLFGLKITVEGNTSYSTMLTYADYSTSFLFYGQIPSFMILSSTF